MISTSDSHHPRPDIVIGEPLIDVIGTEAVLVESGRGSDRDVAFGLVQLGRTLGC